MTLPDLPISENADCMLMECRTSLTACTGQIKSDLAAAAEIATNELAVAIQAGSVLLAVILPVCLFANAYASLGA